MTGAIPPYGANYVLIRRNEYSVEFTQSIYRNRRMPEFEIWAYKGSKRWFLVHEGTPYYGPYPSLTKAMESLNRVIDILLEGSDNA